MICISAKKGNSFVNSPQRSRKHPQASAVGGMCVREREREGAKLNFHYWTVHEALFSSRSRPHEAAAAPAVAQQLAIYYPHACSLAARSLHAPFRSISFSSSQWTSIRHTPGQVPSIHHHHQRRHRSRKRENLITFPVCPLCTNGIKSVSRIVSRRSDGATIHPVFY